MMVPVGGSVQGEIRHPIDGRPVGGARVRVAQAVDAREEASDPLAVPAQDRVRREVLADGEGWFAIDDLPEGAWIVQVEGPHGGMIGREEASVFDGAVTFIAVEVDETEEGPIVDRYASVRGTVVRAGTQDPVDGASVTIAADGAPDIAALTDADGSFSFDGLPPGTWILHARSLEGIGHTTVRLVAGAMVDAEVEVTVVGHLP